MQEDHPESETPILDWRGTVPIARAFDDPYFSLEDGLAETEHVFLAGNDLPARFRPGFHICELGFGTGLNAAAALRAWRRAGQAGPLRFTSFECAPMALADMKTALSAFPDLAEETGAVLASLGGGDQMITPRLRLTVIRGDARETVPPLDLCADAWFLDGFSPAKNPALWDPGLLRAVARQTRPGGTAATYTAAGAVRRALAEAGFEVTRAKGFGRKRHMTKARLP